MKTKEFLNLLENNKDLDLVFYYDEGKYVPESYHITEIKKVDIDSVDCGGRSLSDQQTVVQLWLDGKPDSTFMRTKKALSIFTLVDGIKPLYKDAEIFFEYGDETVKTSTYAISSVNENEGRLEIKMFVPATLCKPAYELQLADCCGPSNNGSGCC